MIIPPKRPDGIPGRMCPGLIEARVFDYGLEGVVPYSGAHVPRPH